MSVAFVRPPKPRKPLKAMAILDIFSKRQARLRGEVPDMYRYDEVPQKLRVQCNRPVSSISPVDRTGCSGVRSRIASFATG